MKNYKAIKKTSMSHKNEYLKTLNLTELQISELEKYCQERGHIDLDNFLSKLISRELKKNELESRAAEGQLKEFFSTELGTIWHGDSLELLRRTSSDSVNLVMTSPPYGLLRPKSYGNEESHQYCDWFRPFAKEMHRVLKDDGSVVIDIGGAWKKGIPTRSLYHFELLIMLCEEYNFHLCLEHFWWNTAKLPSPAEWVNIRRIRPKDAVNCIWWLSKTPWPKSSNRRVMVPYSGSMLKLLKNGYTAKARPSGHQISTKFKIDNGGAVPPNLLAVANTESNGPYQEYCRAHGIEVHPARFPSQIPEYFIRMTTDKNDFVLDPFGGSCMTGMVAERLGRKWECAEKTLSYIQGAVGRFNNQRVNSSKEVNVTTYSISPPCTLPVDEVLHPLPVDCGRTRPKRQG